MKNKLCIIIFTASYYLFSLSSNTFANEKSKPAGVQHKTDLEQEAVKIVQRFAGTLKPLLKNAIQTEGLGSAVKVCSVEAPKIAKDLSLETGWVISRVSLKPRNSQTAAADLFETKVLQEFNTRQLNGEPVNDISHAEVIDNQFRFMKAQGVAGLCLNCHGKTLSPALKDTIKTHYPYDVATGYSLGQIRGAFSLTKNLNKENSE